MSDPHVHGRGCAHDVGDTCPEYLSVLVTFANDRERVEFQKATWELEGLGSTVATLMDLADYRVGEPPPVTSEAGGKAPWYVVGVVLGPYRKDIPDGNKPAHETEWAGEVFDILEGHGLRVEDESTEVVS
jgi:hypothetical protein